MEHNQKELISLIAQMAGEDTPKVAEFIIEKGENVSEFLIAESLQIPINTIRNMLYRLQENNLITFIRKKDKKKGWYIYYWTFNHAQAKSAIKKMKENRISALKNRLKKEDSTKFYICATKCIRHNFENALETNFRCSECGKVLKEMDNTKIIREIRKELSMLEETTEEVNTVEISA